ncbi:MAG: DUF554 domain-containing protein [Deltaproteobacteria bacterium]|nr:DUF554 domain-containing protein [Deltaproteobacteria bacterium]
MVFPLGAALNALVIGLGAVGGLFIGKYLSEKLATLIFQLFGLCLLAIGLKMTLGSLNILTVILAAVLGATLGETLRLSQRLTHLAERLKARFNGQNPLFAEGLVTTSVMVCAGAMAIVGSFEEGLGQGRTTVLTKTLIDFFSCLILAARFGSGVAFAAVAVLAYQGTLTLLAGVLAPFMSPGVENCLQSLGGLLIMAIGVNMLGVKPEINLANCLPALLFAALLPGLFQVLALPL